MPYILYIYLLMIFVETADIPMRISFESFFFLSFFLFTSLKDDSVTAAADQYPFFSLSSSLFS